jgi:phosphoketolase
MGCGTFSSSSAFRLIEHKQYITRYGDDMPEVKQWRWPEAGG